MTFKIHVNNEAVQQPPKAGKLVLGTPKAQEPTQTLAQRMDKTKSQQSALDSMLANPPAKVAEKVAEKPNDIPAMANLGEKYVLTAEATDQLPQSVLDDFSAKMQYLLGAMDTQELPTALHGVLKFAQENPHLRDILRAEDIQLVVRGARASYGLTVVSKTVNKGKTSKKAQLTQDIMDDLADVSFTV